MDVIDYRKAALKARDVYAPAKVAPRSGSATLQQLLQCVSKCAGNRARRLRAAELCVGELRQPVFVNDAGWCAKVAPCREGHVGGGIVPRLGRGCRKDRGLHCVASLLDHCPVGNNADPKPRCCCDYERHRCPVCRLTAYKSAAAGPRSGRSVSLHLCVRLPVDEAHCSRRGELSWLLLPLTPKSILRPPH